MANKITINFSPCETQPLNGYMVKYRPVGNTGAYRDGGSFTISPIVIIDNADPDNTKYEGTIQSNCGGGNVGALIPFTTA